MLPMPIKMIRTRDGRRYRLLRYETKKYVITFGEVYAPVGLSCKHGLPKKFLRDEVEILDAELTEELLQELAAEAP